MVAFVASINAMKPATFCPCGSNLSYEICCGRYHKGGAAPTAESLMRSRYSAYVLRLVGYVTDTWHHTTRPATLSFDSAEPAWCGLTICNTSGGSASDQAGEVEFIARWCKPDGQCGALHERSHFIREEGRWYYVDGTLLPAPTAKIGRNDPCHCGSGRKFKLCCGR